MYRLLLSLFFVQASAVNILWLAGLASPSHQLWAGFIQKALALKGHNITALSVDVDKVNTENLTFLHLDNVYQFYNNKSYNLKNMANANPFVAINTLAHYRADGCIPAFQSTGLRRLMDYPRDFRFDLVVHDFAGSHCLLGFVQHFGYPPLVSLSATMCPVAISSVSGNPQYASIVPSNHLIYGFNMNGFKRLYNFLLYTYDNLVRSYFMMPAQNSIAREHFKDESMDVAAISRSSVLTLVNLLPSDVMQPFYQTVVPVGGLHIQKPQKLEPELARFIEGSEGGVVYFALGTNIKSENFSHPKIKYFLEAFASLSSYRFLWKFDPDFMNYTLPKNVMVKKWMPQNDILAHPRTKVFIGHGGALSCQEAMWYGVPQLMIPFIIDQKQNSARAVERRIALQLDHNTLSMESIRDALDILLHDNSYKKNVMEISYSLRDQPLPPLDRAIFWIEYSIRHGNDSKLRSPGQDYGILEQSSLDITITIALMLMIQTIMFGICYRNLFLKKK